jgi:hypothetical protein
MKIHLFGLPISIHRRLKEESGGEWSGAVPDGHESLPTPLNSNAIGPFSESELRELAESGTRRTEIRGEVEQHSGGFRTRFQAEGEQDSAAKPNTFGRIPEWCSA